MKSAPPRPLGPVTRGPQHTFCDDAIHIRRRVTGLPRPADRQPRLAPVHGLLQLQAAVPVEAAPGAAAHVDGLGALHRVLHRERHGEGDALGPARVAGRAVVRVRVAVRGVRALAVRDARVAGGVGHAGHGALQVRGREGDGRRAGLRGDNGGPGRSRLPQRIQKGAVAAVRDAGASTAHRAVAERGRLAGRPAGRLRTNCRRVDRQPPKTAGLRNATNGRIIIRMGSVVAEGSHVPLPRSQMVRHRQRTRPHDPPAVFRNFKQRNHPPEPPPAGVQGHWEKVCRTRTHACTQVHTRARARSDTHDTGDKGSRGRREWTESLARSNKRHAYRHQAPCRSTGRSASYQVSGPGRRARTYARTRLTWGGQAIQNTALLAKRVPSGRRCHKEEGVKERARSPLKKNI